MTLHFRDYRANGQQPPHTHDELHFSLILRGGVTETVGRETVCAGALAVVAKDAGVVHANQWGRSGVRIARLSVGAETLAELADHRVQTAGWRWTTHPAVAKPFLRLVERAQRGERGFSRTDDDLLDLVAAFTAQQASEPRGKPPVWLRDVVERVRHEWRPTLTGSAVAEWAHVHPVYLARCVRRWYGIALAELLRTQRLRSAIARVADSESRLSAVALDHGYADEPHLCRDITRAVGRSPGRLRSLIKSV